MQRVEVIAPGLENARVDFLRLREIALAMQGYRPFQRLRQVRCDGLCHSRTIERRLCHWLGHRRRHFIDGLCLGVGSSSQVEYGALPADDPMHRQSDIALARKLLAAAQPRHFLPIQQSGDELKPFIHRVTLLPGHFALPQKARLCNPCLRNELSPLPQEGQIADQLVRYL